jgi:hypothetical protein
MFWLYEPIKETKLPSKEDCNNTSIIRKSGTQQIKKKKRLNRSPEDLEALALTRRFSQQTGCALVGKRCKLY